MDSLLAVLNRHLWFLALAVTVYAAFALQRRYAALCERRPELAPAYERFLTWFVGVAGGLWVLMGLGIVAGGVPGVSSYFDPGSGNAWVALWHGALAGLALTGAVWIFFRGGDRFVEQHPGLINGLPADARKARLLAALGLTAVLAAQGLLWAGALGGT